MFGIGFFELCIIVVVALVFVGPQKLPELMRQMGKFFVQIRRMSSEVKSSVDQVMQEAEEELRQEEQKKLEAAIEKRMAVQVSDTSTPSSSASQVSTNAGQPRGEQTSACHSPESLSHKESKALPFDQIDFEQLEQEKSKVSPKPSQGPGQA